MLVATLLTFTLALAETGIARPLTPDSVVRVPLRKRTLAAPNGTFDHDKFLVANAQTMNKHRQNLLNLRANVGHIALNPGARTLESRKLPARLEKRHHRQQQSNVLPIIQGQDLFAASANIGSDQQPFYVGFDTASANFWVPNAVGCSGCNGKQTYTSAASSTSQLQVGTFRYVYANGDVLSGPVYTDTVSINGLTVNDQTFSAVTTIPSSFSDVAEDGIVGMAFQSISTLNAATFFQNAGDQGQLLNNVFAFAFGNINSLAIGGLDSTAYTGSVEYHPITGHGYWQMDSASIRVGNNAIMSDFITVMDSGTTSIYGPPDAVDQVYSAIAGAELYDQDQGLYTYPCEDVPSIGFSWEGGELWSVTGENFNAGQLESDSNRCIGALVGQDSGLGDNTWVLGTRFMTNVYSVFDADNGLVGFAQLT